jgi:hypothetical protein
MEQIINQLDSMEQMPMVLQPAKLEQSNGKAII